MEDDKQLLEAWENGVGLGRAWWAFADARYQERILELRLEGAHLGLQRSLETALVARISAGELQALGIESGDDGPTLIPQRYFWRPEIDWDKETVSALGKKFYEVRVQGEREPENGWTTHPEPVDPPLIQREPELVDETPTGEPKPINEPAVHRVQLPADQTLPGEPAFSPKPLIQALETPASVPAPNQSPLIGRRPSVPMIRVVIQELIARGEFANLITKEIHTLIRRKVKERFPDFFPGSRPSKNTISVALRLEDWPRTPKK